MIAFASNSILCRLALREATIDAASFTALRLLSGALALSPLLLRQPPPRWHGVSSWTSGLALFTYAAAFSFAYLRLTAGAGALVLFGTVQLTMLGIGFSRGQRITPRQALGLGLAIAGLLVLTLANVGAPDPIGVALMALSGCAWGVYSMRGGRSSNPVATTAGNFARTTPLVVGLVLFGLPAAHASPRGVGLAILSGALASGMGYIIWYAALRQLLAVEAALVQLSVPVLAAGAGIVFLGEPLTLRLCVAGFAILLGIAVATREVATKNPPADPKKV